MEHRRRKPRRPAALGPPLLECGFVIAQRGGLRDVGGELHARGAGLQAQQRLVVREGGAIAGGGDHLRAARAQRDELAPPDGDRGVLGQRGPGLLEELAQSSRGAGVEDAVLPGRVAHLLQRALKGGHVLARVTLGEVPVEGERLRQEHVGDAGDLSGHVTGPHRLPRFDGLAQHDGRPLRRDGHAARLPCGDGPGEGGARVHDALLDGGPHVDRLGHRGGVRRPGWLEEAAGHERRGEERQDEQADDGETTGAGQATPGPVRPGRAHWWLAR